MKEYKVIAVDFDGTLSFGRWPEAGEPNTELISFLKNGAITGINSFFGLVVPDKLLK